MDIGAKDEIHRIIVELADAGTAVLVVSTDLAEVQYLADRVLVMRSGSVIGRVRPRRPPGRAPRRRGR